MDVMTHSAWPPQSGVHRSWVATHGGGAVNLLKTLLGLTRVEKGHAVLRSGPLERSAEESSAAQKTAPRGSGSGIGINCAALACQLEAACLQLATPWDAHERNFQAIFKLQ